MKKILTIVKNNKMILVASSALGAGLIGTGAVGMVMEPTYHHIISGIDKSFNEASELRAWINANIESVNNAGFQVADGLWIEEGKINEYIKSVYYANFMNDTDWFTSQTITFDSEGKATIAGNTSQTLVDVWKTKTGTGATNKDTAVTSWVLTSKVWKNEFSNDAYNTHFATKPLAFEAWRTAKTENHTYANRTEYHYDALPWELSSEAAKNAKVEDEARVDGNNRFRSREEFSFLTYSYKAVEADAKEEARIGEEAKIMHVTTPESKWVYNGVDFATEQLAKDAVLARINESANRHTRTRFSSDAGTTYNFSTLNDAKAAYKATLGNPNTRVMYAHDGTNYAYTSLDLAKAAYKATLTDDTVAGLAEVDFYYSDGDIQVSYNKNQDAVKTSISSSLQTKKAISGETVTDFSAYNVTNLFRYKGSNVYYNTIDNLVAQYKIDNFGHLVVTNKATYKLKGTTLEFENEELAKKFWIERIEKVKK